MKLAGLGVLVMPGHITVLILTAIAVSVHAGRIAPLNAGPHGFSEILYDFTSVTNNNGSAFAGISVNTAFYNVINTFGLLLGRFAIMIPVLALAGPLAAKEPVPASAPYVPHRRADVRRPAHRRGADRRGADLLPRRIPRPDRRATQSREVLLMSAEGKLVAGTQTPPAPPGHPQVRVRPSRGLFDRRILSRATVDSV